MTCYDQAKETVLLQQRLRANPVPYGHCLFMFVGIGNRKEQDSVYTIFDVERVMLMLD